MITVPIWNGPSRYDGSELVMVATTGGNDKTAEVVGISLVTRAAWDATRASQISWRESGDALYRSISGRTKGQEFKKRTATAGVRSICPGGCSHLQNGNCYVVDNAQNSSQIAATVRRSKPLPPVWTMDETRKAMEKILMGADAMDLIDVRFMFMGDAGAVPPEVIGLILWMVKEAGLGTLAYTHDWRNTPWLRDSHMASVETEEERQEAKAAGWRCFVARPNNGQAWPADLAMCPASREYGALKGKTLSCSECRQCDGAGVTKDRGIASHGLADGSKKAARVNRGNFKIVNTYGRTLGLYA